MGMNYRAGAAAVLAGCAVAASLLALPQTSNGIAVTNAGTGSLFDPVAKVLMHQRCVNCHPRGDRPRQGDERRLHMPAVYRGPDDHGATLKCHACHTPGNNLQSRVPGAAEWFLAPVSMTWEGLSKGELCRSVKDLKANGNRDLAALVDHMNSDPRVNWSWSPGPGRETPPLSKADFMTALRAWADAGGPCPD